MTFQKWLLTFLEEKGIDLETCFELQGPSGTNFMSYGTVVEAMFQTTKKEQGEIKKVMIQLDYKNQDITGYLKHLAQAIIV
jgi:hypothetical protein